MAVRNQDQVNRRGVGLFFIIRTLGIIFQKWINEDVPPTGRLFVSGNYSGGYSNNMASLFHPNAVTQPWVNSWTVFQWSQYFDANLFFDVTPAMRVGASFQRVTQELADDTTAHNSRFEMTFLYFL